MPPLGLVNAAFDADSVAETQRRFTEALLARDKAATGQLIQMYAPVQTEIQRDLDRLVAKIVEAQAAGDEPGPSWLFQQGRLTTIQEKAEREIRRWGQAAAQMVEENKREAVRTGADAAERTARAAIPRGLEGKIGTGWARLPVDALEHLAGVTAGGPLRRRFEQLAPGAAERIRQELFNGLAVGRNPRMVARNLRRATAMPLAKAMTISRTEMIGAYRNAQTETWKRNADLVAGWVWLSARDSRTCASCWALHGQVFPVEEPMASHPNCRCTMVPKVGDIAVEPGSVSFANLDEKTQRRILGPGKHEMYKNGTPLDTFTAKQKTGPTALHREAYRERSIRDILAERGGSLDAAPVDLRDEYEAAEAKAKELRKAWQRKLDLTESEELALNYCASKENAVIQAALRSGEVRPTATAGKAGGYRPLQELIDDTDKVIARSALDEDTTLYRGFGQGAFDLNAEQMAKADVEHLVGSRWRDPAYQSTTVQPRVADDFAHPFDYDTGETYEAGGKTYKKFAQRQYRLEIHAPAGTNGVYIPAVKGTPNKEAEFLLPRNQEIEITGIRRRKVKIELDPKHAPGYFSEWEEITLEGRLVG